GPAAQAPTAMPMNTSGAAGQSVYQTYCIGCHQAEGQGIPGTFPPLAKSDYLMADTSRTIETVLNGRSGPLQVNGQQYDGTMPPMGHLKDEDIADILSYVLNSWGNTGSPVSACVVVAERTKPSLWGGGV